MNAQRRILAIAQRELLDFVGIGARSSRWSWCRCFCFRFFHRTSARYWGRGPRIGGH